MNAMDRVRTKMSTWGGVDKAMVGFATLYAISPIDAMPGNPIDDAAVLASVFAFLAARGKA